MNRRTFLKLCKLAAYGFGFGFGTTGCATPPKDFNWAAVPDSEFSLDNFERWFYYHRLYRDVNPNLKSFNVGYLPSFYKSIYSSMGASPGIDYQSGTLYASADGEMYRLLNLSTGRRGGYMLYIAHPNIQQPFLMTMYGHLSSVDYEFGRTVKRGQSIAPVLYEENAKLMMTRTSNWVDPDHYGLNHGYMEYWDSGRVDFEVSNIIERDQKQRELFNSVFKLANNEVQKKLGVRKHVEYKDKYCAWDYPEKFEFVEELFNARPQLFPGLSPDRFELLKKEFYANQPIILTLPLKP